MSKRDEAIEAVSALITLVDKDLVDTIDHKNAAATLVDAIVEAVIERLEGGDEGGFQLDSSPLGGPDKLK